jgi:hypothetical protein
MVSFLYRGGQNDRVPLYRLTIYAVATSAWHTRSVAGLRQHGTFGFNVFDIALAERNIKNDK